MADLGPAELVAGVRAGGAHRLRAARRRRFRRRRLGPARLAARASGEQRALIAEAIGPIWEANHVWLILVVVLLFTALPGRPSPRLAIALHIPLTLMLVGIVLRGSAFTFRSHYGPGHGEARGEAARASQHWGRVFAIASVGTPVLLGLCVGALASGALRPPGRAGFAATLRGAVAHARSAWASARSPWPSSPSSPRST